MKIKLSEEQGKPTCLTFVTPVTKQNKVLFSSFFLQQKKTNKSLVFSQESLLLPSISSGYFERNFGCAKVPGETYFSGGH
jgi:hypothetical protein